MIGILGGTFNPIHYGHLRTAFEIKQRFALEQLHLIPSANPPHRPTPSASAHDRLHMLQLAVAYCPGLIANPCEVLRQGPSYTIDTLQQFRAEFPIKPILLFMGTDAFITIHTWHQWLSIFNYAHIVVLLRPGFDVPNIPNELQARLCDSLLQLQQASHGGLWLQTITQLDVSATQIRTLLAQGQEPRFLLPDAVLDYIQTHKLYQTGVNTAT